jgi:hypothetical protein
VITITDEDLSALVKGNDGDVRFAHKLGIFKDLI